MARAALDALGMSPDEHQHVVANRVNLETGRAVCPDLSYLKLDRGMPELELRRGWQHDHGRYAVIERDGQSIVECDRHRQARKSQSARTRNMEVFAGRESLATNIDDESKQDVPAVLRGPTRYRSA